MPVSPARSIIPASRRGMCKSGGGAFRFVARLHHDAAGTKSLEHRV